MFINTTDGLGVFPICPAESAIATLTVAHVFLLQDVRDIFV